MISLRGHHLVCLQFFRGEGYSGEFVSNLFAIVERMADEPVAVILGADDVCAACDNLSAERECLDPGEAEIARLDALACATLGVVPGDSITMAEVARTLRTRPHAREDFIASACTGCSWEQVCAPGWRQLAETPVSS